MEETKNNDKLFWIDMEMTGLDEKTCKVLEVAIVITDLDLKKLYEYSAVIYQPKEILDQMDEWCVKTHGSTGLIKEVLESKKSIEAVDEEAFAFTKSHFADQRVVLCGNSVGQDRKFIEAYMPKLNSLLHYRIVDVSSFKEVFKRKFGKVYKKNDRHRAKDDIYESIAELQFFLQFVQVS